MENSINKYLQDAHYFSFLLESANTIDEVLVLSKFKEDLELKISNQIKYDQANQWGNFDINYDEGIVNDIDGIYEDKPVILKLNPNQIKKLAPQKINSVLLSSGQYRSYDILSNPVSLDPEWEIIHESLFTRITKYIKKTEQLKIIEHLEYNFKFIVSAEIKIKGVEIIDDNFNDIHGPEYTKDLESDNLPDAVDEISHSVDRYTEAIASGNFASKFDGSYTLPGHGGHYVSCMKVGLTGCFGSNIDNQDKNQTSALVQDTRHNKFNQDNDIDSGNGMASPTITHMKKIFLTCKKMSCDKCYKKTVNHVAKNATLRMFAFICYLISNFGLNSKKFFNHSVVSVPLNLYDDFKDDAKRKSWEKVILADLKSMGIMGGIMLYHPYRFSKKLNHAYWSPHYHFILAGYTLSKDVIEFHLKHDFIYVGFPNTDNSGKPFVGQDRLYHTLRYILSHAGIKHTKHTIRYFGMANNRKFKTAKILSLAVDSMDEIKNKLHEILTPKPNPKFSDFTKSHIRKTFELQNIKIQNLTLQNGEIEKIIVDKVQYPEINDDLFTTVCNDISNFLLDDSVLNYNDNLVDNPANSLSDSNSQNSLKNTQAVLIKTIHTVTVSKFNPASYSYTKEKCYSKTSVFVLVSSIDSSDLCRLCNFRIKSLTVLDESKNLASISVLDDENLANYHDLNYNQGPYTIQDVEKDKLFLVPGKLFRYQNRMDFFLGFPYFDDVDGTMMLRNDIKILEPGINYEAYAPELKQELNFSILDSKDRAIKNHIKTKIYEKSLGGEIEDHVNYFHVVKNEESDIPYQVMPKPVLMMQDNSRVTKPIRLSYKTTDNIQKLTDF